MTAEAVFMVGVATVSDYFVPSFTGHLLPMRTHSWPAKIVADCKEYFIKHFMEEGYTKARLDRRKLVTYKDIGELSHGHPYWALLTSATVVSRSDEFDFLRGQWKRSFLAFPPNDHSRMRTIIFLMLGGGIYHAVAGPLIFSLTLPLIYNFGPSIKLKELTVRCDSYADADVRGAGAT